MATPLPGLYLAGVISSGLQANRIFIENGRDHGDLIVAHLQKRLQSQVQAPLLSPLPAQE